MYVNIAFIHTHCSNFRKTTFSFVFVVLFALALTFITTPAAAQNRTVAHLILYAPTPEPLPLSQNGFYIAQNIDVPPGFDGTRGVLSNGIVSMIHSHVSIADIPAMPGAAGDATVIEGNFGDLSNLEELLRSGGTIELAVKFGNVDAQDLTLENIRHRFVITEIMWGLDLAATGVDQASNQWIEIYNDHSSAAAEKLITSGYALILTENVKVDRIGKPINIVWNQDGADDFDPDVHSEANKFYVVDRVSLINRFGQRWEPPGSSGRLTATNNHPVSNLVSMYRKRDLNEERTQYKSDASFGDGSEAGSWVASLERIHMEGPFIGTPGAVQQDDGTQPMNMSFTTPSEVRVGETLTATLNITDAVDLAGVEFDLHFNSTVLEVKDIQEGDLITGAGTFFQVLHFATVPGEISGIRIARTGGVDGSGVLLKVVFKTKAVGVSELTLRNLKVGTSTGAAIPTTVVSGKVEVGSGPDVTGDGKVNILDLVLVSRHFGPAGAAPPGIDINGDGEVDIFDLILVAQQLGASNTVAAPAWLVRQTGLDVVKVQDWLSTAYVENDGSFAFARGIANLEALLARIVPTETTVYANYPNPFNPETWIPYQLAEAAVVTLTICAMNGSVVRTLTLGHQPVGVYQGKGRAAYWDGRNMQGEPVASGVYFYTLKAGEFTATRKMLIRK